MAQRVAEDSLAPTKTSATVNNARDVFFLLLYSIGYEGKSKALKADWIGYAILPSRLFPQLKQPAERMETCVLLNI